MDYVCGSDSHAWLSCLIHNQIISSLDMGIKYVSYVCSALCNIRGNYKKYRYILWDVELENWTPHKISVDVQSSHLSNLHDFLLAFTGEEIGDVMA